MAYTQIVQMSSHRIRLIWGSLLVLMFMFISISNMDDFLQYSIYYWLWLFLSLNDALLVLVCSQCSATCHSACLWRCIFILCLAFYLSVLWCSLGKLCVIRCWLLGIRNHAHSALSMLWVRVEYTMCCMWIWCECVLASACLCEEIVRWCVSVYACVYAEGRFLWVTHSQSWALNILWAPVSEKHFLFFTFFKLRTVWQLVPHLSDMLDQESYSLSRLPETLLMNLCVCERDMYLYLYMVCVCLREIWRVNQFSCTAKILLSEYLNTSVD